MNYRKTKKPTKQNDELLKGAFEENFEDFLKFLYPQADEIFDFSREVQFMDKELLAIGPDRERKKGRRIADILVKVFLKDGTEKWILVHTEIEGGRQKTFAFRVYQYHYRLLDRYNVPIETIVVFTGDKNQPRPSEYSSQTIDTNICFRYRSYHIFDHSEEELLGMDNIFALIVLACQKALQEGKVADEELDSDRLTIVKALLKQDYDHDRILSFLVFLKNFLYINNSDINRNFDQQVIEFAGGTINMGVIEIVKKQERQQGLLQGRLEGKQEGRLEERAKAEAEKLKSALNFKKMGIPVEDIAKGLGLTIEQVEKLK